MNTIISISVTNYYHQKGKVWPTRSTSSFTKNTMQHIDSIVYGKNTRALIGEIVKTINSYFNNMLIELHKAVLRDQAETFKYVYVRRVGDILSDGMYIRTLVCTVHNNSLQFSLLYINYSYCYIHLQSFIQICLSVLELELEED